MTGPIREWKMKNIFQTMEKTAKILSEMDVNVEELRKLDTAKMYLIFDSISKTESDEIQIMWANLISRSIVSGNDEILVERSLVEILNQIGPVEARIIEFSSRFKEEYDAFEKKMPQAGDSKWEEYGKNNDHVGRNRYLNEDVSDSLKELDKVGFKLGNELGLDIDRIDEIYISNLLRLGIVKRRLDYYFEKSKTLEKGHVKNAIAAIFDILEKDTFDFGIGHGTETPLLLHHKTFNFELTNFGKRFATICCG